MLLFHTKATHSLIVVALTLFLIHNDPPDDNSRRVKIFGTVLDAQTGKSIADVRIIPTMESRDELKNVTWQTQYMKSFHDGTFLYETDRAWEYTRLRVEAEGYLPAITRAVRRGEEGDFEIRLERQLLTGVIKTPDGKPAEHAEVALGTWTNELSILDGHLAYGGPHGKQLRQVVKTDARGRFSMPAEIDRSIAVVAHETGYAELTNAGTVLAQATHSESEDDRSTFEEVEIQLKPWARIEARLVLNDEAVKNATYWVYPARSDDFHVSFPAHIETDATGRFVIEQFPPTRFSHCQRYMTGSDGKSSYALSGLLVRFDVAAGESSRLELGSPGRSVIGTLDSSDSNIDIDYSKVRINVSLKSPSFRDVFDRADSNDLWTNFLDSAEGKAYVRNDVRVNEEGKFRVEGLPAGEYQLEVTGPSIATNEDGSKRPDRTLHVKPFSVGAERATEGDAREDSTEPMELGRIVLQVR